MIKGDATSHLQQDSTNETTVSSQLLDSKGQRTLAMVQLSKEANTNSISSLVSCLGRPSGNCNASFTSLRT